MFTFDIFKHRSLGKTTLSPIPALLFSLNENIQVSRSLLMGMTKRVTCPAQASELRLCLAAKPPLPCPRTLGHTPVVVRMTGSHACRMASCRSADCFAMNIRLMHPLLQHTLRFTRQTA